MRRHPGSTVSGTDVRKRRRAQRGDRTIDTRIGRRDLIRSTGAFALAMGVQSRSAQAAGLLTPAEGDDTYFLSDSNPIANVDQQYLEALAIELFNRPDVEAAKKRAAATWAFVTDKIWAWAGRRLFPYRKTQR